MIEVLPPGLVLLVGALGVPLLRGRWRQAYMLALVVFAFAQVALLPLGLTSAVSMFGYELILVRVDELSRIFGLVFCVAAFLGVVYALHVDDAIQGVSALMYAGAAIAAVFVGDLISLFIFWELTAIASLFQIWARRTERSYRSGMRYLIIQVGSGVLLLAGTIFHYADTGSISFGPLELGSLASILLFLAFGIKAAFPLLHSWMEDAYPEATVTGTVFLSAFTTKLAIYALARSFPGEPILISIGAVMAIFPIFYVVIENDLRRLLAYSLNSQLGFMVVGIGIGTEMALNGTVAHAFASVLYKALLFMCMGAVLYRVGTVRGSDLGGLYRSMPWTTAFCIVGAASISAFPLFSGFVTKSLVLGAAAKGHHTLVFLVLLFASVGAFLFTGIKVPYTAFFARDRGIRCEEAPPNMLIAMGLAAVFCVGIGIWPASLYALLPHPLHYEPYTTTHVVSQLQLLAFAAAAFVACQAMRLVPPVMPSLNLDVDWVYRKLLPRVVFGIDHAWARTTAVLRAAAARAFLASAFQVRTLHAPHGVLGEPWSIGRTVLWSALLLIAMLLLAYW